MPRTLITRRDLIRYAATSSAVAAIPACHSSSTPAAPSYFTADERKTLGALADAILPPDDTPGGNALGAVSFIEKLLTAFDQNPPAIFAGGPYSGRTPFSDDHGSPGTNTPPNDFARFLPLDRVADRAWRIRIYGSSGVDGGTPNDAVIGPTVGLRDQIKTIIAQAVAALPGSAPIDTLDPATLKTVFFSIDRDLRDMLTNLVIQAAFSAPEYGGNKDRAGWKLCHFEGDSLPLGYSLYDTGAGTYRERPDAPVSTANAGPDPEPMDDASRGLILKVVAATGGRTFG